MLTGARILLTGATGRLGRCLAGELARHGAELVLVVRASSPESARQRIHAALAADVDLRRVTPVCGDVSRGGLGLRIRDRRRLEGSLDLILHAAATTSFTCHLDAARSTNVEATANVLRLAERVPGLRRLGHVSTAFVAGKRTGRISEDELDHERGFQNTYQQSKHEAEQLVRLHRDRIPVAVYRPSIVLDGPSAPARSAFRYAFELVRRGLLPALPGSSTTPVDLVAEDDAARAIAALLAAQDAVGTYHVAAGDRAPSLGDIVDAFGVRYLSEDRYRWALEKWRHSRPLLAPVYDELSSFIFELAYPKVFDTTRAEAVLGGPVAIDDPLALLATESAVRAEGARVGARR